jgi:hypothetical protein
VTSLAPVPSDSSTCASCSAPLVAGQRYCLSCGQPASPVRLAFLDVLDSERASQLAPAAAGAASLAYAPYVDPAAGAGALAWLRRYVPLLAVASVLLTAMIAGLLVGHWATQSKGAAGPQVVKIEYPDGTPLASAAAGTPATPATATTHASGAASSASSSESEEAKERAEAKAEEEAEEKAPAKAPKARDGTAAVGKLEKTTGRKHEAELNKISTAPIEVK